jgi:ribosomal protein S27AE
MPRSREIKSGESQASLNKTCPKCGFTITPDLVKRVDFDRMECPEVRREVLDEKNAVSQEWSLINVCRQELQ